MLRRILSMTAVVAIVSAGSVYAQDATTTEDMKATPELQTGAETGSVNAGTTPIFPDIKSRRDGEGFFDAVDNQILASSVLGWPVYELNVEDQQREQIGDVNDFVMMSDGSVDAAVIGIGGFLGIGEKNVAISISELGWSEDENGNKILTLDATREELENAPAFETDGDGLMRVGVQNVDAMADHAANTGSEAMESTRKNMSEVADSAGNAMNDMASSIENTANDVADSMDPTEGMSPIAMDDVSFDDLIEAPALTADGDSVGEVSEVITYGDQNKKVLIIDVGGFLGIGEKPVAIAAEAVDVMTNGDTYVIQTGFDRETLENQPEYTKQAMAENPDAVLLK